MHAQMLFLIAVLTVCGTHALAPRWRAVGRHNVALFAKRRTTLSRRRSGDDATPPTSGSTTNDRVEEGEEEEEELPLDVPVPAAVTGKAKELAQLLADDISDFERSRNALMDARERERVKSSAGGGSSAALQSVKDVVGLVLIADFFVVIVFLVWFLFAAAMQSTNPFFLEKFQDIFQPVVVPCLTVLMAGSIASGVVDNAGKKDGEDGNNDRR